MKRTKAAVVLLAALLILSLCVTASLDASDEPVSNKIVLKVDIPKEMANAKYNGTVFLESIPSTNKAKGAVAQAVVRMPLQVAVAVTGKQILKGAVNSITTADVTVSLDGATLATENRKRKTIL